MSEDIDKQQICLVLGANGFVGSYLSEALSLHSEVKLRAFDRFSKDPQFLISSNMEIFKGDIFNDDDLRAALKGADFVMHSFSATTPFIADKDPYTDITQNLLRSVRIFELCAEMGVKKIGFISSAGTVYGSVAERKPAAEDDAPLPVSPYGINKLSIEYYLEYFKRKHGTDYIIYRLTNPYGPRQIMKHNQGVIPAFIQKINISEQLNIFGDGTSSRDYIFMKDAAAMISTTFYQTSNHHIYNIGSGIQVNLNQIIAILADVSGKKPTVRFSGTPATFLSHSSVSIARYRQEFGDTLTLTSLEEGLRATYGSQF